MKDKLQQFLSKPLYVGIAAGVVGLLVGWMLLGWVIFPVSWYDAAPSHLRADVKVDYARMAIDSFAKNQDAVLARTRFNNLGQDAQKYLDQVASKPGLTNPTDIEAFKKALAGQVVVAPTTAATAKPGTTVTVKPGTTVTAAKPTVPVVVQVTPTPAPDTGGSSAILLVVLCVVLLGLGGVLAYLLVFRNKKKGFNPFGAAKQSGAQPTAPEMPMPGVETPIAQFMTSYKVGVDLYDDSFSIDSLNGEFLGECGVGISDTIGVGDPKKVTAFEVWLFDKNDIQTITKVLMSEHAFNDPATTQRLASKGEPVLIKSGEQVLLETATLQLVARVVDMNYGQGALPANSFFDRLTLELAIWPKPKA